MFNFVNGFDIVPRLLGQTTIHTFAKVNLVRVRLI